MSATNEEYVPAAYEIARERYSDLGVDTELALARLEQLSLSLHCWQGDDLRGFEAGAGGPGGGIVVIGEYPGRARNPGELRDDLDLAYSLVPGTHRLSLHSIYAETGGRKVERNDLLPEHFESWVAWAKSKGHGLDMNPTCFGHPLASDGFTLSNRDPGVRRFWIEHCAACRRIGDYFGRELGTAAVTNIWIPDGFKDTPVDRLGPRRRLLESLDAVFVEEIDPSHNLDAVEPKLFGIGSESYVAGSMEFYSSYALTRNVLLTLDSGHFHPTESISDKFSSLLLFVKGLFLHVTRGIRWDSDHVVTYDDDLQAIMQELVRGEALERVRIGLDYFDASINRVAAWVIGSRSALRALLAALLEPLEMLRALEAEGDLTGRLALLEELKAMPSEAVWDYFCMKQCVPVGMEYMNRIRNYEKSVLSNRGQ